MLRIEGLANHGQATYYAYRGDEAACFIVWSEWRGCYLEGKPETPQDEESYQALHALLLEQGWRVVRAEDGETAWYPPEEAAA